MTKEFWINLPVKDLKRTKDFYTQLGFTFKPLPGNREDGAFLILGTKNVQVMFFEEYAFKSFTSEIADTKQGNEVLFSIDAENTQEVNNLANRAKKAGGDVLLNLARRMDGCMVVVLQILMDTDGLWFIWMKANFPRENMNFRFPYESTITKRKSLSHP